MNIPRLFVPLHLQAIKAYILVKWGCLLLCSDARGSATPLLLYSLATCKAKR